MRFLLRHLYVWEDGKGAGMEEVAAGAEREVEGARQRVQAEGAPVCVCVCMAQLKGVDGCFFQSDPCGL